MISVRLQALDRGCDGSLAAIERGVERSARRRGDTWRRADASGRRCTGTTRVGVLVGSREELEKRGGEERQVDCQHSTRSVVADDSAVDHRAKRTSAGPVVGHDETRCGRGTGIADEQDVRSASARPPAGDRGGRTPSTMSALLSCPPRRRARPPARMAALHMSVQRLESIQSSRKMRDAGIGRVLVAALHQGIADELPDRLEFYENWLNPQGLRNGTIGLAPLGARARIPAHGGRRVRSRDAPRGRIRGGLDVEELPPGYGGCIARVAALLRRTLAMRVARNLVQRPTAAAARRRASGGDAAKWKSAARFSAGVRGRSERPLCLFYAAAVARVLRLLEVEAAAAVTSCQAEGDRVCHVDVQLGPAARAVAARHGRGGRPSVKRAAAVASFALLAISAAPAAAQQRLSGPTLVMPFTAAADARSAWLGEAVAMLLTDDIDAMGAGVLTRDERIRALERLQVPPRAGLTSATAIKIGQLVGASTVVTGSAVLNGDVLTVGLQSIRIDTGRVAATFDEHGPLTDMLAILERSARRLVPSSNVPTDVVEKQHPPLPAYESYVKGLLAETPATAITYLQNAIALAPTFDRARLALASTQSEVGNFEARAPRRWRSASRRRLGATASSRPRWLRST